MYLVKRKNKSLIYKAFFRPAKQILIPKSRIRFSVSAQHIVLFNMLTKKPFKINDLAGRGPFGPTTGPLSIFWQFGSYLIHLWSFSVKILAIRSSLSLSQNKSWIFLFHDKPIKASLSILFIISILVISRKSHILGLTRQQKQQTVLLQKILLTFL